MDEFFKMDIFFATTTAVVVLIGAFFATALFYLVRIFRSVDRIMQNVSEESDVLRNDIADLREQIRAEGMKWKHWSQFVGRFLGRVRERAPKTRSAKKDAEEASRS